MQSVLERCVLETRKKPLKKPWKKNHKYNILILTHQSMKKKLKLNQKYSYYNKN